MPSPVQCSPFVVGKCRRSGRCFARSESAEKSAPKPPDARITGPCSWRNFPANSYSQPTQSPTSFVSKRHTRALQTIFARSEFSAHFSSIWISAYVMVIPGKRSAPRARLGVAAEASDQGEVEAEVVHEPLHVRPGVVAEHLDDLRLLGAAAESVRIEGLVGVEDPTHALRARVRPIDAGRRLRRVAAAEGRLVQEDDPASVLEDRVGRRDPREPATNHDRLGRRENSRHREKASSPT